MSTDPGPNPAPAEPAAVAATEPVRPAATKASLWRYIFLGQSKSDELAVYHHNNLYYWWPIWFFGYLFAAITYFGDMRMTVVPPGTEAAPHRSVAVDDTNLVHEKRDVLILPAGGSLPKITRDGVEEFMQPRYFMAQSKAWGAVFVYLLLLVIIITNVTMQGLWSFLVLIILVMFALLATAAGWWDKLLVRANLLAVYINLAGYLAISTVLLVFWIINFFVFDRQTYMIFTPGQVRLCLEIGGGETVYDTTGMVIQKKRGDLFRHWILGFGSGDLVIRPAGIANPIELTNVLRVQRVVRAIENMVKEKVVFTQPRA